MDKRDTILIVDDVEINRVILSGLFERDYNLLEAENGQQAMLLLEQYHSVIAVMLLDVVMPIMDGYQVLTEMSAGPLLSEVPVVVITAEGSAESEVRAFDLGASDIIMKPFEPYVVKRRVQNIVELNRHRLHLEELVEEQAKSLRDSNEVMIDALSSVIEYRSVESGQHILRIRMFTKILLEDVARTYPEYGLDQRKCSIIASAAAMHDIGKIAIPDAILNKPGALTREEFEVMKTHSMKGCEILGSLDRMSDKEYLRYAYNICRWHHERWDGRGYPDGLKGDNIPVCAQVVGIADAYDALTTDRVYKKAFPHEQALNMILNGECGVFSPKLLDCLKNVRNAFQDLSKQYADGRSPKQDRVGAEAPVLRRNDAMDTLQTSQMKYYALLHYIDSTVVEVEFNSGIYHMLYLHSQDFELMRTGSCFEDTVHNFSRGAVHPEDRAALEETMTKYIQSFFQDGVMRRTDHYRIINRITGNYRWCQSSILRVDAGDPRQRRALIVWSEAQAPMEERRGAPGALDKEASNETILRSILGGIQRRRNDQYLTLLDINERVMDLTGYTGKEIAERFQNRFLNLIYPIDRDEVLRQTREQLQGGNTVELEYRVVSKSGRVVWVLDKGQLVMDGGGEAYFCCLLLDVTQSKTAQEELRLTLERHKIIMEQSNDVIFEWNIQKDEVIYSDNWKKKFGYEPIREQITKTIPLASHLYPEDIPSFMGMASDVASGIPYSEIEVRIAKADGRYLWCRIRATTQYDGDRKPIKAVGVLVDVDDDKRATQALQDKAEQDALTKLYNKSAIRRQVDRFLGSRGETDRAAMLIIDVDNFKTINDRYGHMFGDAVLTEIASGICRLFRSVDAVARIGGDEFMVFMRRIPNIEIVQDRAQRIIETFRSLFHDVLEEECRLSCSIGVSLCPDHGVTYQDLFQRADRALYQAKGRGKNQYVLYEKSTMDGQLTPLPGETAVNARIDSDESGDSTGGLIQQAFRQLYESEDIELAVPAILSLVGTRLNISRCYIFELSRDGTELHDTFEWRNKGIPSSLYAAHPIQSEALGGYYPDHFNESGIFYCPDTAKLPPALRDILTSKGIRSMLQCAIRDNGTFKGYVGFDDCTMRRMWNREQINAITFISELISTFLLKRRAQDRALENARNLHAILDHQNTYLYVADPETYELLYANANIRALIPGIRDGMYCHSVFLHQDAPCDNCPMRNIREGKSCTLEMYNDVLGRWTLTDASLITWEDRQACLLSCRDISQYKSEPPQDPQPKPPSN